MLLIQRSTPAEDSAGGVGGAHPRLPRSWDGSNTRCSCSTGAKARNCADACRAQQERAASFPRAGHLHLQTRPANQAGLPTAVPRRSSFVPPASTSSSPRSRSGTPPKSPTPSPISVRLNNRCPMHGSPIHRRSAGGTSASSAISCGSGPPRPQISAAPSISARRKSLHDPRLSQSVRP
jgi:hypothetical protein